MAQGTGLPKVYSGYESGTMYFWHTNRFRTDANTLFALSSSGMVMGVTGSGSDFTWYGDTAGDFILFDESEDRAEFEDIMLRMMDDTPLQFGDGSGDDGDYNIRYALANTRLEILPRVTNGAIWFGNGVLNPDLRIAGSNPTNNIFIDASEDQIRLTGMTLEMQSTAKILLNDTGTFIHSNADGKITISADGAGADDINLAGSVSITDNITMTDGKGFAQDVLFATDKKTEYRDDAIYVHSSADGILNIVSDNIVYLNGNVQRKAATETLSANKTFVLTDAPVQFLDPGGAARTLFMPATSTATRFEMTIINTADAAEAFDVNTAAGTTFLSIAQNETGFVICNGSNWGAIVGKAT